MGVSALELRRRVLMEAPHRVIESGASVSFETYVRQKLPVTVAINPVQAGTGDPSPDNIRDISGWSAVIITRSGTAFNYAIPSDPGTVYGGKLTVNRDGTGTLTVTHRIYIFDGVNVKFASKSLITTWDEYYFNASTNVSKYGTSNSSEVTAAKLAQFGFLSNYGVYGSSLTLRPKVYIGSSGRTQPRIIFNLEDGINTVAKCNAKLADLYNNGNPLMYYMALKTYTTYNLTELQVIEALQGENVVSADTGDVTVEFWTN